MLPLADIGRPIEETSQKNTQPTEKFAIPLANAFTESGKLNIACVRSSLAVFSETQPIFVIANNKRTCNYRFKHNPCNIKPENCPPRVDVVVYTSRGESCSFRVRDIVNSREARPSIIISRLETLLYRGKPDFACVISQCSRECINAVMRSQSAPRFINALAATDDSELFRAPKQNKNHILYKV
ncbi:hypothetical protein BELL_2521g00010 [Botrytis elliptica]|uniref:Uncharacterized protein n=1 Tax=Botrytis elliptica TaxID=278938 RepID=A0A4Z1HI02_9HELO|nr:hypothetical protein BELL_2521g00010 [Botrytis elliptica]